MSDLDLHAAPGFEISQLYATIRMFAPSIIDAKRQATRFKRRGCARTAFGELMKD